MKKFLAFIACAIVSSCSPAFAGEPLSYSSLKPLCVSSLKGCDCNPCTCDPATCACPNCDIGCKRSAGTATANEVASFVGADAFFVPQAPTAPTTAAPGFHTEYRKVCNGTSCQMVAVSVPDLSEGSTAFATTTPSAYVSGTSSCASCASGAQASGQEGRVRGPIRRILGRIFRGRKGGGCG